MEPELKKSIVNWAAVDPQKCPKSLVEWLWVATEDVVEIEDKIEALRKELPPETMAGLSKFMQYVLDDEPKVSGFKIGFYGFTPSNPESVPPLQIPREFVVRFSQLKCAQG